MNSTAMRVKFGGVSDEHATIKPSLPAIFVSDASQSCSDSVIRLPCPVKTSLQLFSHEFHSLFLPPRNFTETSIHISMIASPLTPLLVNNLIFNAHKKRTWSRAFVLRPKIGYKWSHSSMNKSIFPPHFAPIKQFFLLFFVAFFASESLQLTAKLTPSAALQARKIAFQSKLERDFVLRSHSRLVDEERIMKNFKLIRIFVR